LAEQPSFYSVVRILRSDSTAAFSIDGRSGVIVGIAESASRLEYGVLIDDEVYGVDSTDVQPTGEVVTREAIYDGSSVSVKAQRYAEDE
jgi:hypothetical protein